MWVQNAFAPLKRVLPRPVSGAIRSTVTAFFTPFHSSVRSGHFRSSFARKAVDRAGNPLPWYSYPAIEFLSRKDFSGRRILEFGAGQSTHWWASRAASVVAIEDNPEWTAKVRKIAAPNVSLHVVPTGPACIVKAMSIARQRGPFDIVVIDGLHERDALLAASPALLTEDGAILFDNADCEWAKAAPSGYDRVDFYGSSPGVIMPQSTAVFFRSGCFLFR